MSPVFLWGFVLPRAHWLQYPRNHAWAGWPVQLVQSGTNWGKPEQLLAVFALFVQVHPNQPWTALVPRIDRTASVRGLRPAHKKIGEISTGTVSGWFATPGKSRQSPICYSNPPSPRPCAALREGLLFCGQGAQVSVWRKWCVVWNWPVVQAVHLKVLYRCTIRWLGGVLFCTSLYQSP